MFKKYALVACIAFILGASVFSLGYIRGGSGAAASTSENTALAADTAGAGADGDVAANADLTQSAAADNISEDSPTDSASLDAVSPDAAPTDEPAAADSNILQTASASLLNQSVSSIVKQASSSVVSINVSATVQSWFGSALSAAAGSGIIFSQDSGNIYVVTNYHVVDGAVSATISLDDKTQITAHYVGGDSIADIAVLRVAKSDLKAAGVTTYTMAKFGDSDKIEVGDFAIAIGNADGEGKSATFGIISAVNKQITIDNNTFDVLQTDAAINPGNSGGALINSNAEVVGVNCAKLSDSNVEGMGYSLPINQVKTIVDGIMKNKGQAVSQPGYLGITGVTVTTQLKNLYGFPSVGVYVQTVYTGTGAYNAGLMQGDLITAFNGVTITTNDQLNAEIAKTLAGQTVDMTVYRSGYAKPTTIQVTMTAQSGGLNF
ncbi:MAG: trypsin-like peptidase domain-containing protein [Defluviitaleaceae bacterium]|nr:trypsin-like peptidase domain-containing protein [Defluviitaleaceae bacterium]